MWVGGGGVVGWGPQVGWGRGCGWGWSAILRDIICGTRNRTQTNQANRSMNEPKRLRGATVHTDTRNARHARHRPARGGPTHTIQTRKRKTIETHPAATPQNAENYFLGKVVKTPHTPCFTYYRGLTPICCVLRRCCPDPTAPHTSHVPDPPPMPPPASPLTD